MLEISQDPVLFIVCFLLYACFEYFCGLERSRANRGHESFHTSHLTFSTTETSKCSDAGEV